MDNTQLRKSYNTRARLKHIASTAETTTDYVRKVKDLPTQGPQASQVVNGKEFTCQMQQTQETQVQSLGSEDTLEQEVATHSRILTWRILWTEQPGELQSIGFQRVGHDWAHVGAHTHTHTHDEHIPLPQVDMIAHQESPMRRVLHEENRAKGGPAAPPVLWVRLWASLFRLCRQGEGGLCGICRVWPMGTWLRQRRGKDSTTIRTWILADHFPTCSVEIAVPTSSLAHVQTQELSFPSDQVTQQDSWVRPSKEEPFQSWSLICPRPERGVDL